MIDLSSFPKFGNMTKGSGLAGIFDTSISTPGYAEFSGGYAGVNFSADPKRISKVEIVPAANGFDASGSRSAITLTLRGKKGSAPTGMNDGVSLASVSFTDINAQLIQTITSTDKETAWDYVWVSVTTGVWSVMAEIRMYEPEVGTAPEPSASTVAVYQKACNEGFSLPQSPVIVPGFTFDVATDMAGVAMVDINVNVAHVGNLFSPQYLGAIGIGVDFLFKYAADFIDLDAAPWRAPDNSRGNGVNIDDRNPAHYANVMLPTSIPVVPGFYRFTIRMSAHTDGDPRNGLAVVGAQAGKGLNGLRVTIVKGGAHFDMSY